MNCSDPASAVGASLSALTVTTTSSVTLAPPAVTLSWNVRAVAPVNSGMLNVAVVVVAPVSVTVGVPPVCVQA